MAPRDRCRFCNQLDLADNLLDPCACYKKKDSGRTHKHCLEAYISKWEHEYRANPDRLTARAGLHCSECGKRFRVRLNFRASTKHFWTRGSINTYLEGAFVSVLTLMVLYALALTFASAQSKEELLEDEKVLIPMIVLVFGMVLWSFKVMFRRWKHAQVEVEVTSVV